MHRDLRWLDNLLAGLRACLLACLSASTRFVPPSSDSRAPVGFGSISRSAALSHRTPRSAFLVTRLGHAFRSTNAAAPSSWEF
ncbi:hypothetical protein NEOLEDRAFT_1132580 [Neolentinus lepideus HHB14362 ss-1]|uniref:Secreted protein n=1 Tax=Neolentinus lepideus HHB14362 ss-1 TaxID=1314782 RepID=A0A165T2U3_9AGAM|nr:hypothetical protein NEOLEDRAFT_1132580 [Neolentinus lepideus HHB14362 ss-1]